MVDALLYASGLLCFSLRYELKNTREVFGCDMITSSYRYWNWGETGVVASAMGGLFAVCSYTTIAVIQKEQSVY